MINKAELNKLGPKEKVRKLKQLRKELKKDFAEIGRILHDSAEEEKINRIAEEVAPQLRTVDISALFGTLAGLEGQVQDSQAPQMAAVEQRYTANQEYSDDYKITNVLPYASTSSEPMAQITDSIGEIKNNFRYESETEKVAEAFIATKTVSAKVKRYAGLS